MEKKQKTKTVKGYAVFEGSVMFQCLPYVSRRYAEIYLAHEIEDLHMALWPVQITYKLPPTNKTI